MLAHYTVSAAEGVRHVYLDHLGSIRQVSTSARHYAGYHAYFPFGEEAPPIEHDGEAMKFTGHERDFNGSTTATMQHLDYMHARFYNPNLARFLTIDPGRDNDPSQPQSWNLYAYTRGNPMKYVDPDGRVLIRPYGPDLQGHSQLFTVHFEDYGSLLSDFGKRIVGRGRIGRLLRGADRAEEVIRPWTRSGTGNVRYLESRFRKASFEKAVFAEFQALGAKQAAGMIDTPGIAGGVYSADTLALLDRAVEKIVNQLVKEKKITQEDAKRIQEEYSAEGLIARATDSPRRE